MLTPISPGDEEELNARLRQLPQGEASPFHQMTSTHFARFVILDRAVRQFPGSPWPPRPQRQDHLLFTATSNSSEDGFVEELRQLGSMIDEVWGHCVAYPGRVDRDAFHEYFRRNRLPVQQWFAGYDASVEEVRNALDLRERHIAFALEHQRDSDADLRAAFLRAFPRGPQG